MKWYSRDANGVETPLGGGGGGQTIQVNEMPAADVTYAGTVYQYVGATTQDYIHNYFYECVLDNGVYAWVNTPVQDGGSGGQTIQVDVLPVASVDELNNIYQYVGADTLTLKNSYFYKCVSDGQDPATYSWIRTDTQPTTPIATEEIVGKVKPDGETITIDPDGTIHALGGGGGVRLANVSGAEVTSVKQVAYIKWSDPPDYIVSGIPLAQWDGTKVLRKVGSAPTGADDEDAVLIVDNKVRDAYASTPFEDNTVQYGVQYYYKFFPYTVDELYTNGSAVGIVPSRIVIEDVPSQNGRLEYTGTSQSPTWNDYDSDKLIIGGDTSGTTVGTYTATFTPKSDYMWADGTQSTVNVTWTINNIAIAAVPTQAGDLPYTGTVQSPTWNGYDPDELTVSGDTSGTAIGTYTATFTPKANYEWWDGTTTGKTADWTISEVTITTVPTQQGTLTYDGTVQTAVWNNFDTDQLTVTGNTGTDAGTYTASFTPKSGYKWSDGTTTAKTADWVIDKAQGYVILSTNSITLDESHLSTTVTITSASCPMDAITIYVSDPTVATVTYDNNGTFTITSLEKGGLCVATISASVYGNYSAATANLDITGDFFMVKDWKDGINKATDAELATLIAMADAGDLDLTLYWAIGDKRTVHLDAITAGDALTTAMNPQDVVLVLMDTGTASGYKDVNDKTVNFVWGQENCLSEPGKMNASRTNNGSWGNSNMKTDLNDKYYNALPSTFRNCLKQFKAYTGYYNINAIQESENYICLFGSCEVFGDVESGASYQEQNYTEQVEYYKTASNRIKLLGEEATQWWNRTPGQNNNRVFIYLYSSDGNDGGFADTPMGVAPFGCI